MLSITRRDVEESFGRAMRHMDRLHHGGDSALRNTVRRLGVTASVMGGAFATGFVVGRVGPDGMNIPGTPVPAHAVVGVAGHALGLTGVYGEWAPYAHSFFDGVLAVWAGTAGIGVGRLSLEKNLLGNETSPPALVSPSPGWQGPAHFAAQSPTGVASDSDEYTEAELAAMAA